MKRLVVLGAGTAGTMVVNKLSHELNRDEWKITIVDQDETHYYQPGFLFIPFGIYGPNDVIKPKRDFIPAGVEMIVSEIELIEPDKNQVKLVKEGRVLKYDFLVIATGTHPAPKKHPACTMASGVNPSTIFIPTKAPPPWPNNFAPGKVAD